MLFPPSSVFPRFPLPLVFSRNVSGGSRVKSSEETLIGSDSSLSRFLPSFSSSLSSHSPHVLFESSPVGLECSRKYFRVRPIRPRENLILLSGFLHLFPRRSSISVDWPTLSLSDLDVQRAYGLWPWNFPSSRSLSRIIFVHYCFSIYLLYHDSLISVYN